MTILHIDSSITGEGSASRQVTMAIVGSIKATGDERIVRRDLALEPLDHLTLGALGDREVVDEFLAADTIVIGAPMYNFTLPSQLKAWIDRILIAGVTFRYTENGPEGLAGGRRVIVALSRGGLYGPGSPAESLEHVESYLRGAFGFIGIEPEFVLAEGLALGAEERDSALAKATEQAFKLAA